MPPSRSSARTRPRASVAPREEPGGGYDKIIAVAIASFSSLGYEGTTTAAVARTAGVTQPLIHHHFGSKEGLWRAAMDVLFADLPAVVAAAGDAPVDAVSRILEGFVRFVAARPEVTRVIAREGATPSPRLDWLVGRHLQAPMQAVMRVLRAGQRGGVLRADLRPELLFFLILGAGSHLFDVAAFARASLGIDTGSRATRDAFVALVEAVVREGALLPPARRR